MKRLLFGLFFISLSSFSAECIDDTQRLDVRSFEQLSKNVNSAFREYTNGLEASNCSMSNHECTFFDNDGMICEATIKASGEHLYSETVYECNYRVIVFSNIESERDTLSYRFLEGQCSTFNKTTGLSK